MFLCLLFLSSFSLFLPPCEETKTGVLEASDRSLEHCPSFETPEKYVQLLVIFPSFSPLPDGS